MSEIIDYGLKAKDRATLETGLEASGLLVGTIPVSGVAYYFIGPVETSPVVLDDDGNVVTAAILTTDVYANVRLYGEAGAALDPALLAAFPDTTTPMIQDGETASYAMDLRVPITAVWA